MRLLARYLHLSWIGLCAVAMLWQTRLLFHLPAQTPGWLDGMVFCGTVFGYAFTHPDRAPRYFAWGLGAVAGLCWAMLPWLARVTVLAPGAIWSLYYGLRRPGGRAGLRARPLLKPLAIALAWAWVTVLLPLAPAQWPAAAALVLGRTAFIFALALAYDLCDLDYDRAHGLETLARRLGLRGTLLLIDLAFLLSGCCAVFNFILGHYSVAATAALLSSLLGSAVAVKVLTKPKPVPGWSSQAKKAAIDGLMLAQFLFIGGAEALS